MKKVFDLMKKRVLSIDSNETIQKAISKMDKYDFDEIPVTKEGKLVGIASRVDIGRGFLSAWYSDKE